MQKKTWVIIGILLGVILLTIVVLPLLIDVDRFRPEIEGKLQESLGRQVTIGHLSLSIIQGDLKADDISIGDDPAFGSAPFVRAKSLEAGVSLTPLIFSRTLHVTSITLREPEIALLRSASGQWNFSTIGQPQQGQPHSAARGMDMSALSPLAAAFVIAASDAPEFSMEKLTVSDGHVTIGASPTARQTYEAVNLTAENVSFTSSFPFKLQAKMPGAGTLELDGNAGPINRTDATQTPFDAKVTLKNVDLVSNGLVDPSSGIAGVTDFDGSARSDGKAVHSEGTAKVSQFRAAKNGTPAKQPVSISYVTDYELAKKAGELTTGQLQTGKSAISISGDYDMHGEATVVHLKLTAPDVPVEDIQALLPALGVSLPEGSSLKGGTAKANLSMDGAVNQLVTAGSLNLSNATLSGFNFGSKLSELSGLTGVKPGSDTLIQVMSSNVHAAPDGIRLDAMNLVLPDLGTVTGAGTIAPNNALNFKMLASIANGGSVGGLASRVGLGGAAGKGVPFFIEGTESKPQFRLDASGMMKSGLSNLVGSQQGGGKQAITPGNIINGLLGAKKK